MIFTKQKKRVPGKSLLEQLLEPAERAYLSLDITRDVADIPDAEIPRGVRREVKAIDSR